MKKQHMPMKVKLEAQNYSSIAAVLLPAVTDMQNWCAIKLRTETTGPFNIQNVVTDSLN